MFVVEKTFQQIWCELSKKGWKYKKSTGLSNGNTYLPPAGNLRGTEGVDFFEGETSLLSHCRRQRWLALAPPLPAPAVTTAAAAVSGGGCGTPTAPTSVVAAKTSGASAAAATVDDKTSTEPAATPGEGSDTPAAVADEENTTTESMPTHGSLQKKRGTSSKRRASALTTDGSKRSRKEYPLPGPTDDSPYNPEKQTTGQSDREHTVPDTSGSTRDSPEQVNTEAPEESESNRHSQIPERNGVLLDDFDSGNFLYPL
ncbi:uncharacterized protein IUM83_04797 [Phytophthora cinnamomi]|uniref:uncharacterized protein n=1 Tax=Phytophthora cinnamomi TaxID=4785 RepID=UPI003559E528|nr:hypothetical protein IUM83_04797 [Phytophthora cinnamomi]